MRELNSVEVQHINGGTAMEDVASIGLHGLNDQAKTVGVIALGIGISVGGLFPGKLKLLASLAVIAGWFIYSAQSEITA